MKIIPASLALGLILAFSPLTHGEQDSDNRWPHIQRLRAIHFEPPDEVEMLNLVRRAHLEDLSKALENMRMAWHGEIALKDTDYFLYLYASTSRINPGTTSRVLVLLDMRERLKTWAQFNANIEAYFGYGTIMQQQTGTNTYFVTVNTSGQYGGLNGALFFEKYAIFRTESKSLARRRSLRLFRIRNVGDASATE